MKIRLNHHIVWDFNVNKVIRYFIISDLTFLAGWGLIDPIFAIFAISNIPGATLVTLGIMAAIYWGVKSIVQVPIALYLDKTKGEKDDFYALIVGLLVASLAIFSWMAASTVTHLYIIQFVKAIAFGLYVPAWSAIFSRHLDKERTAFEWALSSTAVGVSMGVAGVIGAELAKISFKWVFLFGGFLTLASALILLLAPNLILPPKKTEISRTIMKDHRPANIQK